ncbi:MAG: TetR family transcriptional regulator [Rhodobacterales bacterium]|nr:TetR family transcriptional regulator [Rhodobacterales bacterium]
MTDVRQARAIETRNRLLAATVEALVEVGYAGTTTQEVCRRTGASRGKLLHHFPTRSTLLIAALDEVLTQRVAAFVVAHDGQPRSVQALIREMWQHWKGPAYYAWLELAVAARTDANLREPLRVTMRQFDNQVRAAFRTLVPVGVPEAFQDVAPMLLFATLNGLAVDRIYSEEANIEPSLQALTMLAEFARNSEVSHG